jgi:ribose transport system permease protein
MATLAQRIYPPWLRRQEAIVLLVLIIVVAFLSVRTNTFLTGDNLWNVARNFTWIAIPAFGESLVIMIGGVDLSVGAVMALASLVSAMCLQAGWAVPLAVVAGLVIGSLVGWANGMLVGHIRLPPFVVTLGTLSIIRGITFGLAGGWPVRDLSPGFRFLGQADLNVGLSAIPVPVLLMLALAALVTLVLNMTVLGRYVRVLGDSERALLVAGISLPKIKVLVYTLCGFLSAVGGILMTARLGVASPNAAAGYELDIIAAAVIGGTSLFGGQGSVLGVLLGAALMQVLRNGLVLLGLPSYWQTASIGALILVALLLDARRQQRAAP